MANQSKFKLQILQTQAGKTGTCINIINYYLGRDKKKNIRRFHIVLTPNTILNHVQFLDRIIDKCDIKKEEIITIKSNNKKENDKGIQTEKNNRILSDVIISEKAKIAVFCENITQINGIINVIMNIMKISDKINFNIYIDEIHKIINYNVKINEKEEDMRIVINNLVEKGVNIYGFTATPQNLFTKKLKIIEIIDYKKFYKVDFDTHYRSLTDSKFINIEIEKRENTIEYLKRIINLYGEKILAEGKYIFIPAMKKIITHEEIKEIVKEKNIETVIIILNSKDKAVCYKQKKYEINVKEDLMTEVVRILKDKKLMNKPKVITAYGCINVGQTLMHNEIGIFDYGIISHFEISDDDLYQLIGRITGNTKTWLKNGKNIKTKIYCPRETELRAKEMESKAINIMNNFSNKEITKKIYNTIQD